MVSEGHRQRSQAQLLYGNNNSCNRDVSKCVIKHFISAHVFASYFSTINWQLLWYALYNIPKVKSTI